MSDSPLTKQEIFQKYHFTQKLVVIILVAFQCAFYRTRGISSKLVRNVMILLLGFFYLLFQRRAWILVEQLYERECNVALLRQVWEDPCNWSLARFLINLGTPPVALKVKTRLQFEDKPNDPTSHVDIWLISAYPLSFATKRNTIMLYLHGGGTMVLNTENYMGMLCEWSKILGIPIVSVDYSLSPGVKFPTALNQIVNTYKYLKTSAHDLGISSSKVIVTGDSAGGYLAAALTTALLTDPDPQWSSNPSNVPEGLVLVYPTVTFVKPKLIFPSFHAYRNDFILPGCLLQLLTNAYIYGESDGKKEHQQENVDLTDPLISPLYTPTEILAKFPPTFIATGQLDPLLDDSKHFFQRLVASSSTNSTPSSPPSQSQSSQHALLLVEGVGHNWLMWRSYIGSTRKAEKQIIGWMQSHSI